MEPKLLGHREKKIMSLTEFLTLPALLCAILYLGRRGAGALRRRKIVEDKKPLRVFRVDVWYASGKGAFRKAYWTSERAEEAAACFREEGYEAVVTMMERK